MPVKRIYIWTGTTAPELADLPVGFWAERDANSGLWCLCVMNAAGN